MKNVYLRFVGIACVFMLIIQAFAGTMDESAWQKFDTLERAGQYELARQFFFAVTNNDPSNKDIILLLVKNKRLLGYEDNDIISYYWPYKKNDNYSTSEAQYRLQRFWGINSNDIWVYRMSRKEGYWKKYEAWLIFHQDDFRFSERLRKYCRNSAGRKEYYGNMAYYNPLPSGELGLKSKDEINSFLIKYDAIKNSIEKLKQIITYRIKQTDVDDLKVLVALLQLTDKQKSMTKKIREVFLSIALDSYLSPCQIAVSVLVDHRAWLCDADQETLNEIGRCLSLACHKQWLFQSRQWVRESFFDIISKLKKEIPESQFNEFKARYSLLDSNDPSKARGSDAWWK